MARFALLHASDLHFFRREHRVGLPDSLPALVSGEIGLGNVGTVSSHDLHLAEALAQFAFLNQDGLDAILISGDLATTGAVQDLTLALNFLTATPNEGDYRTPEGFPTLAAAGKPIVVVPGNHDRFGPLWQLYRGGNTQFDSVFGDYWGAEQGAQLLWTGQRDGASLALIGADFCVAAGDEAGGPPVFGHLGRGHVSAAVTDRLVELTQEVRQQGRGDVVLWAIHFEPEAAESTLTLFDPEDLLSAAVAAAQPAAILCGHTHLASNDKPFAGTRVFVSGTTTQWFAPYGNYLQVVEVDVGPAGGAPPQLQFRSFQYGQQDGQSGFY
jgi:hypothetical protein